MISYAWKRPGEKDWKYENKVLDVYPAEWLAAAQKQWGNDETYRLLHWSQISKEAYDQFHGLFE